MERRLRLLLLGSLLCLGWLLGGCSSQPTDDSSGQAAGKAQVSAGAEDEEGDANKPASTKTDKPFRPDSPHLRGKDPFSR